MINIAMIGCGGYAFQLLKRLWLLPDKFNVVAVSSRSGTATEGGKGCADRGIKIYSDIDELLANVKGKADAIFVPTPIHTHKELAIKCIDNGFDVLLEKPPVATIQDLLYLDSYAKKHNKRVAVLFQSLYTKIIKQLKDRIVSGEFGKVIKVRGVAGWPRMDDYYSRSAWAGKLKTPEGDWVLDGTINNPLAHMLSNELYLASMEPGKMEMPAKVTAELYHAHDIESEDTASVRVVTQNGIDITFNASLCSENNLDPINLIICEKATIEYINFNEAKIRKNGDVESIIDDTEQRVYMLEQLYESMTTGSPFACGLDTCIPFTTTVNAAFESTGSVKSISGKYITRREQGDTIKTVINDIDKALKVAFDGGKLFSELGLPWTKPSTEFTVENYTKFPSK